MNTNRLDRFAIIVSVICCIHCLATPFIIIMAPWLITTEHNNIHLILLCLLIPLAFISLYKMYLVHHNTKPFKLGFTGIVFLTLGLVIPHEMFHDEMLERVLTTVGSIYLILGHYYNIKQCHCHKNDHNH